MHDWRRWRKDRRLYWLRKIKQSKGCEYCGFDKSPLALDFAHRDGTEKHSGAAYGAGSGMSKLYSKIYRDKEKNTQAIITVFKEIRKCRILCKNCHVVETFKNREWFRQHEIAKERKKMKKDAIKG